MSGEPDPTGVEMLRHLSDCSETDIADKISCLCAQRKLSGIVRALNRLLYDPAHGSEALCVLRRMGLEYGG
jgi:hypothetical protein